MLDSIVYVSGFGKDNYFIDVGVMDVGVKMSESGLHFELFIQFILFSTTSSTISTRKGLANCLSSR